MVPGLRQLFTPLAYLRIRNPIKPWFDWYIPLVITALVFTLLMLLPGRVNLFGETGLVAHVTQLLQMLIGFYIAALAAVATFPSKVLDQPFAGDPVQIRVERKGQRKLIPINRRRFLSYLFGYLAFLSLFLFLIGMSISVLHNNLASLLPKQMITWTKPGFTFVYIFLISNLMVTTLLGLHYLTDRIHRPPDGDGSLLPEKPDSAHKSDED
ncbi:hypothetical protein [uncultured Marinobacter sp.]|uniref:hypothetical protein n=1 Tax=uncultured Marinobacter sp. TaxID=187379 RepID=UPI00261AC90D|nr:hypothetical protein [uncultured Marinobacter sp.]